MAISPASPDNIFESAMTTVFVVLSVLLPAMGVTLCQEEMEALTDQILEDAEYAEIYALVFGAQTEVQSFVKRRLMPRLDEVSTAPIQAVQGGWS